jgi:hypothetical protein
MAVGHMHARRGAREGQVRSVTASMMGADPSLSSAGAGHGSMTAETATARNNAPTAISKANIGLLRFQHQAGQTRKSHSGSRMALKRFTAHPAPRAHARVPDFTNQPL